MRNVGPGDPGGPNSPQGPNGPGSPRGPAYSDSPFDRLPTGVIQRAIAVLQARGSHHDNAIRQVTIDGAGMHIGEPLPRVAHVLSGSAALTEQGPWPIDREIASPETKGGS